MAYTKTNWQNSPSTNTPLNADNLNHIEQGIADIYTESENLNKEIKQQKSDSSAKYISSMYSYTSVTGTGSVGVLSKDNETSSSGYKVSTSVTEGEVYKISGRQFNKTTTPAYLLRKDGEVVFYEFLDVDEYFSNYEVGIPSGVDELIVNLNSATGVANALKKASKMTTQDVYSAIQKANANEAAINKLNPKVDNMKGTFLSSVISYNSVTVSSAENILMSDNTVGPTGYRAYTTVEEDEVYQINGRQFNSTNSPAYIFRLNGEIVFIGWLEIGYFSTVVTVPSGVDELVVNLNSSAGVTNAIKKASKMTTQEVYESTTATDPYKNIADISKIEVGKNWTGAIASNKAILYIPIDENQKYTISLPASNKILTASVIQQNRYKGDNLQSTTAYQNRSITIQTQQDAHLFLIQFNGASDLTISDFSNYNLIVKPGDGTDASGKDYYARKEIANNFDSFYNLAMSQKTGISRIGGYIVRNTKSNPISKFHQQHAWENTLYYDVNTTKKQYEVMNNGYDDIEDYIINKLPQEEIDFTPDDDGFTRIIMGKNKDDLFFVSYVASSRKGHFGDADHDAVEITSDFVNFTRILKGNGIFGDGIEVTGKTFLKVQAVKQFADGSYLIPLRCRDIASDSDGTYFYKLSADMQTLTMCEYENLNGNIVPMVDEFNGQLYDWHVDIKGSKGICTTYGSRQPETDYGRVWYTEDNGNTWKQVFQMTNHYQDGVAEGIIITQTHMHGVMLDAYSNRMFIIAGEDNRNIFWSDKGMETTDNDWNVIPIRQQTFYQIRGYSQVVGGFAFKNSLVFGSDNTGLGTIDRLNKQDGGNYSLLEPAHEFLPNYIKGTTYCQAEIYKRDSKTPLLFCMTRENAGSTEAENEQLNNQHRGRVVASYDGFKWTEIWRDDTYGSHDVNIDGQDTTRNYSYCTRGMNCYLLKNGDAIIKYSGRDFYYFGGEPIYSVTGYSNGSCKVRIIRNLERYL